ncbi:MAG TPA: dipeptidase [Candidatus Hydrogenedentes bacterium]|nr:dipeptidase [Candidatus Hydrogenedentota bacterium]
MSESGAGGACPPKVLAELREFLAIPSVSTLPEHAGDVRRTAEWLCARLRGLGMDAVTLHETPLHPIVCAEWLRAGDRPTVLVYGHYDVQPVDPLDEWDSAPFDGDVRGDFIYARGASDMKGQLFALLKGLEALRDAGEAYPVNLKFLLEGAEEIGSQHLPEFMDANRDALACDVVLNCDAGVHAPDTPSIVYALRGLAYFELEVRTLGHDLHSGLFGGSVRNPIHVLAEALAAMHDADGRVTLPRFYDRVRPLDAEERALIGETPFSKRDWLAMTGAAALQGEKSYTTMERVGARPTLEVNGVWGGFTGQGAKTVLPARASAKLSMRLVPDQRPEDMEDLLREFLETTLPGDVFWDLKCHSLGPGAVMNRKSPFMRAAADALEAAFGKSPLFKREGGSVPVVAFFQQKLGVDSIMLGFALPDDGIHGPNERQHLPTLMRGVGVYADFLRRVGTLGARPTGD